LNHFAGTNQKKVVRTVFVVHTTLAGLNYYFRFEPGKSGTNQRCGLNHLAGLYHFFPVQTGNAGLNQSKVV
jgi:hypothetical protein